jgi:hypothetical protein
VLDHKEALAAISNEAVQVAALEEMLAAVADKCVGDGGSHSTDKRRPRFCRA